MCGAFTVGWGGIGTGKRGGDRHRVEGQLQQHRTPRPALIPPSSRRESRPARARATAARFYWRAVGRCGSTGPAIGRLSSVACVHRAVFSFQPSHFIISAVGRTCGSYVLRTVRVNWLPNQYFFCRYGIGYVFVIFYWAYLCTATFFSIGIYSLFSYWSHMYIQPLLFDWEYIQPFLQTIDLHLSSLPFRGLSIFAIHHFTKV